MTIVVLREPMDSIAHRTPRIRAVLVALMSSMLVTVNGCGLQGCTTAGCTTQATITIRRMDGRPAPVAVRVELDGQTIHCPAPASAQVAPCDNPLVSQAPYQDVTGQFEQHISIAGTPREIQITIQDGTRHVGERVFTPTYQRVHPNGRGCDPVCHYATERWEVP